MPELKASPRNRALGLLADALSGAKSAADTVQLPVVGGLGSLLFGDAPELVNDVAYYGPQSLVRGGNAATGGLGTFAPDRRVLDAIGVAPMAPGAVRAAKTVANPMTYGRAFVEAQAPAVMSPITAWHGSPHKFRKFDNSKMGTGEGAQAYGAGAYLADARGVAEEYRRMLSADQPNRYLIDGVEYSSDSPAVTAQGFFDKFGSVEKAKEALSKVNVKNKKQVLAEIENAPNRKMETQTGYLYKADIPDEAVANMLLWDKPLSEQPESVRNALKRRITSVEPTDRFDMGGNSVLRDNRSGTVDPSSPNPWLLETYSSNGMNRFGLSQKDVDRMFGSKDVSSLTGEQILSRMVQEKGGQKEASQYLNSLGIPGIRYFDAGSRGAGAGTMNTVVFDDSIIKILERNGVPLGLLAD